jgi:hypothetical protein
MSGMKNGTLVIVIVASLAGICSGQTQLKYYGVHDIETNQYSFLKNSLKGNFALIELPSDTSSWRIALSEAEKNNLKLIIWSEGHGHQWTPWAWNSVSGKWDISEGLNVLNYAEQYTSSGGTSLLALLMSHEPFYNNGSPFTAAQMKALYSALKNVAPHVKLFVYMNDMAYYDKRPNTKIEDGIMDIAGIWKHWFGTQEGTMADAIKEIDDDYDLIKQKGLNIQLFFALQTFATDGVKYRMPAAAEMETWGRSVLERKKLDGVFWYPWNRSSTDYSSWLSKDRYDSLGGDRWGVVTRLSSYLTPTSVEEREMQPAEYSLSQNFPNPFNPATAISYQLPARQTASRLGVEGSAVSYVTLKVSDVLGREVATLVNRELQAGTYQATFDASHLGSGVYFYQLRAGTFFQTRKMVLTK